jgi:sugar lactone lactonase YvrE
MRTHGLMARTLLLLSGAVLAVGGVVPAYADPAIPGHRPTTYIVSEEPGTLPEGIAVTSDGTMYVTSVGTGAVYRGSVTDPRLTPFLPAGSDGRTQATGIHLDGRGRIFVAGFATHMLFVYDQAGRLLAARTAPHPEATLNDLAFADDAVYVTDSATQTIWRAALHGDEVGPLESYLTADAFTPTPGFLNGIVATPDGRALLVADQSVEALYRVDLATGTVAEVPISGGRMGADGLLLEDHRLYGVINFSNASHRLGSRSRRTASAPPRRSAAPPGRPPRGLPAGRRTSAPARAGGCTPAAGTA